MFNSFATPWIVVCQAPLFMRFPRQEYWSELPFPSPRDLHYPGIEPVSPVWQADSLPLSSLGSLHINLVNIYYHEHSHTINNLCNENTNF